MIRIIFCLAILLASFATLASPQQASSTIPQTIELHHVPVVGERLRHNWRGNHSAFALELSSQLEGQERVYAKQLPTLESEERRISTDWILAVDRERVTRMRRTWTGTELWGKFDPKIPGESPVEVLLKSPLSHPSTSVVFTHVPEENRYGAFYDQSAMAEDLLANLRVDWTCAYLLPSRAVAVGSTWDVELEHLIESLAPNGAMGYRPQEEGSEFLSRLLMLGAGGCTESLWNPKALEGFVRCTLEKVERTGTASKAYIQVQYKFATDQDRTPFVQTLQTPMEIQMGTRLLRQTVRLEAEGQGQLVWNLKAQRAHSLQLVGTENLTMEVDSQNPKQPVMNQVLRLRGTCEQNYRVSELPSAEEPPSWTENPKERSVRAAPGADSPSDGAEDSNPGGGD